MNVHTNKALNKLTRRRFLRGAGGAAVALPLLHGASGVMAQNGQKPERFIGLFVANGLPNQLTDGNGQAMFEHRKHGFTPLEGLKPFQDKICMVKGINAMAKGKRSTPHTWGCGSFLSSYNYSQNSANSKGGTTIDWEFKKGKNIETTLPTLNTGWWGADDANQPVRIIHSFRGKDQPNSPIALPHQVFNFAFGNFVPNQGNGNNVDPMELRKARYRASILDAVLEDYKHVMSNSSGYGSDVRNVISTHLDHVRELEKSTADVYARMASGEPGSDQNVCEVPGEKPRELERNANGRFPPKLQYRDEVWNLNSEIYVAALRCDLFRTGTFMVDSGGDKWGMTGKNGKTGNIHGTTLHSWESNNHQPLAYEIFHWYWTKMASTFLERLDSDQYVDVDGGTLLDNTTVLIGTELNNPVHSLNNMTFMLAGGGKFKQGKHVFNGRSDSDFYTTVLKGCGVNKTMGDYYKGDLDGIIA